MRIIKLKNLQESSDTYCGQTIEAGEYYIVQSEVERDHFELDTKVNEHLATGKLCVNDGESDLSYTAGLLWIREQRIEARTVNCVSGRRLHDRFITIQTATQDSYDNTDWQENDYGDLTYIMKDVNGATTTVNANAKETWIDFEPEYDYEIAGGAVFVPDTLDGNDDNAWEIHVVGVPDLPAAYGGNVHLIANPRVKWVKGSWLATCSVNNPANLNYDATYHTNKIRFVFKHPVGAATEFQLRLNIYK